jgi:hypothetical protein
MTNISFVKKKNRPLLSSYQVISDEQRYRLIKLVVIEAIRVKDAAEAIGINY